MKSLFFSLMCLGVLVISSHANAQNTMSVADDPEQKSYVTTTINDDGTLEGVYPGWCANANIDIYTNQIYSYTFYSSLLSSFPSGLIDKPQNLDSVNWLINQKVVGKTSPNGLGDYTYGDEQVAIWTMLNFTFTTDSSVQPFSQARVDELTAASLSKGNNFKPKCSQIVGIILDVRNADNSKAQTILAEIPRNHFPKCIVPPTGLVSE